MITMLILVFLNRGMQPSTPPQEDDYTPGMALQYADYSKQTTQHYQFLQDAVNIPQVSTNERSL